MRGDAIHCLSLSLLDSQSVKPYFDVCVLARCPWVRARYWRFAVGVNTCCTPHSAAEFTPWYILCALNPTQQFWSVILLACGALPVMDLLVWSHHMALLSAFAE